VKYRISFEITQETLDEIEHCPGGITTSPLERIGSVLAHAIGNARHWNGGQEHAVLEQVVGPADKYDPVITRVASLERSEHNTAAINAELARRMDEVEKRLNVMGTKMYWKQDVT